MKKFFVLLLILISVNAVYSIGIETEDNGAASYNPFKPSPQPNRWYYGGNVGFNFWNNYLRKPERLKGSRLPESAFWAFLVFVL